jgi:hypothetical protein
MNIALLNSLLRLNNQGAGFKPVHYIYLHLAMHA